MAILWCPGRPPCRRAAAALELALLLPILTTLLVLGVALRRVLYHHVMVTNRARNGALYASDPTSPTLSPYANLTGAALADWPSSLTPNPTVVQLADVTDAQGNGYVEVQVSWTFTTITSYLGGL